MSRYRIIRFALCAFVATLGAQACDDLGIGPDTPDGDSDRAALMKLYDATNGPGWTNSDGWGTDAPLRTWHGVATDGTGRVLSLDLSGTQGANGLWLRHGLVGPIPPELGDLTRLTRLVLEGNELTGPIPPELGNLPDLGLLDLGDNSLTGRDIFRLLAGEMEDAEAQQRLESVGVRDPGGMLASIRALDAVPSHAHARSTTRNLLANLLAQLLADGMVDERPATVLNRFERVVGHSGAAASLYRTLLENDDLRRRLFVALAAGDLFAERLSRYPELLDFLASVTLDTDAFRTAVAEAFAEVIETAPDVEPRLDPLRRAKAIEEFKVLAEWLVKRELDLLNDKLSLVADAAIDAAARCASDVHGPVPDASSHRAGWAAFALGKLGGRELTVHSDLDLVFLYAGETSDAPRFKRHQKFVKTIYDVLGRVTAAGSVYELDTRLRPEGKKGALAIPLAAFERYIEERAEIWERMAWTRARFVAGDPAFAADVQGVVNRFVYGAWASEVPAYARHIRARIERELADEADGSRLDLKRGHGGLADIDFLLQVLQLREGRTREEFRVTGTRRLLGALPDTEFLAPDDAAALRRAYALFRELETVLRIDADASIGTLTTDAGALDTLARRLRTPVSGADLLARYRETTREVRAIYEAGMNRLERD